MGAATAHASNPQTFVRDPNSKEPLYLQLHASLLRAIESGAYPAGSRLPPLEEMASSLQVSRDTVRRTFNKLSTEGLLIGSANAGFQIRPVKVRPAKNRPAELRDAKKKRSKGQTAKANVKQSTVARAAREKKPPIAPKEFPDSVDHLDDPALGLTALSVAIEANVEAAVETLPIERQPPVAEPRLPFYNRPAAIESLDASRLKEAGAPLPFRAGFAETREFPLEIWETIRNRLLRERSAELLGFKSTFGYLPLRQAIAERLRNARGVKCSPEQVIITAGSQLALTLALQTIISPGDVAGMEEPGAYAVKAALQQAGARVVPLLVDDEGLNIPASHRQSSPVLIYTTPSNQFPLGAPLSVSRRLQLLDYAHKSAAWIIEDDSDGDFCYSGHPLPSLQGADLQNRVIYLGTTGRTMFTSLEIGYLVVPASVVENFSKVREIIGGHPSVIDQATLAMFLAEGHFDRHVRRMNLVYHQRLQVLSECVQSELSGFIDLEPAQGGLHAVGWLARGLNEDVVSNCARNAGIELPLLSSFGRNALVRPGVVFGFASYSEKMIRQTIKTLGQALRSPKPQKALSAPRAVNESQNLNFFRRFLLKRT